MSIFSKRKRIARYLSEAEAYISKHYRDHNEPRFSEKLPNYHVQFSIDESTPQTHSGAKYSYSDRDLLAEYSDHYDSEAIDRAISSQIQNKNISSLNETLDQTVNQTFVERVIALIRVKNVKDSAVYKAAQIDRRLFSKMMSDRAYKPAKDTAIALALALQLPLTQANDLLSRAGYTFSHSSKRDVVIEYFFRERIYNLTDINLVLDKLDLKLIGR